MLDKLDIQETISRYHAGGSTGDLEQVVGTFLPDGTWEVPALGIRCQGQGRIREEMSALLAPIEYLVQINAPAVIDLDGDRATARSLVRESAKLRDGGVLMDVVGQFSDVLERTADGWRFAHRTFTVIGSHVTEAGS